MVNLYVLLVFFCSFGQLGLVTSQATRAEDVHGKFTLAGGPKSHLFSQCVANAMTVEGSLYSMAVSEDEDYVRFVPKETREMAWMNVELDGENNIIQCADKAFELSAYMFKYDGGCSVTLKDAYDPKSEQGCGGSPEEIVYITSRPLNFFNGVIVPVGESYGCFMSTEAGMTFGDDDNRLVAEAQMPPKATCCNTTLDRQCLVIDCAPRKMSHCEAKAWCHARGLPLAAKESYATVKSIGRNPTIIRDVPEATYLWIDAQRGDGGLWRWVPDNSEVTDVRIISATSEGDDCLQVSKTALRLGFLLYGSTRCTANSASCVFCFDANSSLPAC